MSGVTVEDETAVETGTYSKGGKIVALKGKQKVNVPLGAF